MASPLPTALEIRLGSPTVYTDTFRPSSQGTILFILNLLFILLGILSFLWIVIGTPLGIIFLIVYLVNRSDPAKKKFLKISLICLAGLPVGLVLIAIASTLFGLTHLFFSPNISNLQL